MTLQAAVLAFLLVPSVALAQPSQATPSASSKSKISWQTNSQARLNQAATWSLTLDGNQQKLAKSLDDLSDVLDQREDAVRVAIRGVGAFFGADFAVYVKREGLEDLFDGRSRISPNDLNPKLAVKGKEAFVIPPRGTVAKLSTGPDSKRVNVATEYLAGGISIGVVGNVDASGIAKVITKEKATSVATKGKKLFVTKELTLRAQPGGAPFIRSTKPFDFVEVHALATKGEYSLVAITGESIQGWIATKRLEPVEEVGEGMLEGVGSGPSKHDVEIPKGTLLFDRPHGIIVGEVRHAKVRTIQGKKDGEWTSFTASTSLGDLTVWAQVLSKQ